MATTTEETIVIKNVRTEEVYTDEAAAAADIASPDTDTTDADVSRSVTLDVLKGVGSKGQA
jgi:hypothetical protein